MHLRLRSLAELAADEEAFVGRIDLPAEFAHRLMELGFVPDTPVSAGHCAPGGDPRVYRIDGTEIALRLETARHIFLRSNSQDLR